MSKKIVRDATVGAFTDSLRTAGHVRDSLMRSMPKTPTARDLRRDAGRAEGFEIGRQEGFAAGLQAGRQQAYEDARKELDQTNAVQIKRLADSVEGMLSEFDEQRQAFFMKAEEALAGMAAEIARRAIARELEQDRESLVRLAHEALTEATDATKVKLRVNPMDASMMEAHKEEVIGALGHIEQLEIVEDRSIDFGCRLETDLGMIDARVDDYLARIVHEATEAK